MLRILLATLCLIASAGFAQTAADYSRMMDALSGIESRLLDQQSALGRAETAFDDPIWTRDSTGAYRVISGAELRGQIESLVFLAQTLDLDDAALEQLPFATRLAASLLSEDMAASLAVDRVMQGLRENSASTRAGAMQGFAQALEQVRTDFTAAMNARDALMSGEAAPAFDTALCGQPQPADARVFAWTSNGPSDFYWDAGGVYCDTFYYSVVVWAGDRLIYYKCSDAGRTDCTRQTTIYRIEERDGNTYNGRNYVSPEALATNGYYGSFSWRQCRPALDGRPPC